MLKGSESGMGIQTTSNLPSLPPEKPANWAHYTLLAGLNSPGKTAFRELFIPRVVFPLEYGKTLVWNPEIFLRDKLLPVPAGSRPWQWGPQGWALPTWMPPTSEQMAGPYLLPREEIPHGTAGKKAHTRSCLTTTQPWEAPLVRAAFSCSFLALKTLSFITRKLLFFFLLLSRSSSGLPLFLLSPTHYCSALASDHFNHQSSLPLCCPALLIKMTLICSFSISVIKAC